MNGIGAFFLLAVYRLDVFEANSLYLWLITESLGRISSRAKQHLYLESFLAHAPSFLRDWNVRHLFSFSVILSPSGSVQILASSSITWPQNPSQVLLAKESWSFIVIFGECKGHKQITKLEKCCTHGMYFVLFWRHVILKSGVVQNICMHAHIQIFCPHMSLHAYTQNASVNRS